MKKSLFASLAAVVLAAACTTTNPTVEPKLTVEGLKLDANKTVNVAAAASDLTFTVNANVSYTIVSDKDWAVPAPAAVEAENNADKTTSVKIGITANTEENARTAKISIVAEENASLNYEFTINQAALTKSLSVTNNDMTEISGPIEVESTGAGASVMVVSTVSWTATSDAEWLTVEPASLTIENYEETPAAVSFVISDNDATESRTATVTFSGEGVEDVVVTVRQAAVCTFELAVSNITSSGAVIEVKPTVADAIYTVDVVSTEAFNSVNDLATVISYLLAGTKEDVEKYGYTLGSYYSKYGYSGNYNDDWNGYLTAETEFTAVVYALKIDGDDVTPYVSGAKTINFKTLEMTWETPEGLAPANSKDDYIGSWDLVCADLYSDDTENPYVYWPVTLVDGGNDGKYEYVTINDFLPFNSTMMPTNSYNLIYKDGYLYFAPGIVPYTDKFISQGTSYDLTLYCLASTATSGNISTKMMMAAGLTTVEGETVVRFKSLPSQTFNADGFYISVPALQAGLCGFYNISLTPPVASEGSALLTVAHRQEVTTHKAIEAINFKRANKIK